MAKSPAVPLHTSAAFLLNTQSFDDLSGMLAAGQAWGPWFLLVLFGGILVWEEVWDLPNTAYLSAWLLLLITAGAMVRALLALAAQ